MEFDLSIIWFGIIIFATLMYIFMDGFDLGIGILMPFIQSDIQKDTMVNSVAPVWDGNETWLVLGGAALFGAFPLAYAIILEALTIPLTLMLIALLFRGVAFEFRFKALPSHLAFWDKAFMLGSIIATYCQGVVVGAVVKGFYVSERIFIGGQFDWFSPFPLFCGFGLLAAYALLGSTWLIAKTEGALQQTMYKIVPYALCILFIAMGVISVWTPFNDPNIAKRWFSLPNIYFLAPIPILTLILGWQLFTSAKQARESAPFMMALFIVFLGFAGLGISLWPHIIPPNITLWQAAAPQESQRFMLIGTVFIIPVILVYTFWSYHVFAGKVKEGENYH